MTSSRSPWGPPPEHPLEVVSVSDEVSGREPRSGLLFYWLPHKTHQPVPCSWTPVTRPHRRWPTYSNVSNDTECKPEPEIKGRIRWLKWPVSIDHGSHGHRKTFQLPFDCDDGLLFVWMKLHRLLLVIYDMFMIYHGWYILLRRSHNVQLSIFKCILLKENLVLYFVSCIQTTKTMIIHIYHNEIAETVVRTRHVVNLSRSFEKDEYMPPVYLIWGH